MNLLTLLHSVDPTLGRVDYSSFSDQTLMEMLLDGFDDKTKKTYQGNNGMYLDVCKWICVECDHDKRVIEIHVHSDNASGSIELCYAPPKVKVLRVSSWGKSEFTGSVDLTHLPDGMQVLNLQNNQLTGEIDVTQLPDAMESLDLQNNQLTGEIDLTQLLDVEDLSLGNNQLTGELDLTRLPAQMYHLDFQSNRFTGGVDLTHLPEGMKRLTINDNQLSASLILKRLPPGIRFINARRNNSNAVAVVDSETHAAMNLRGSGVTSVVDGNGKAIDSKPFLR